MQKGERAVIVAGYDYAQGERGYPGVIPERATLVFDVELIDFEENGNIQEDKENCKSS